MSSLLTQEEMNNLLNSLAHGEINMDYVSENERNTIKERVLSQKEIDNLIEKLNNFKKMIINNNYEELSDDEIDYLIEKLNEIKNKRSINKPNFTLYCIEIMGHSNYFTDFSEYISFCEENNIDLNNRFIIEYYNNYLKKDNVICYSKQNGFETIKTYFHKTDDNIFEIYNKDHNWVLIYDFNNVISNIYQMIESYQRSCNKQYKKID